MSAGYVNRSRSSLTLLYRLSPGIFPTLINVSTDPSNTPHQPRRRRRKKVDWRRRWLRKGNVETLQLPKRADGWDTSSVDMDLHSTPLPTHPVEPRSE